MPSNNVKFNILGLLLAALAFTLAWQSPRPVVADIEGTDFAEHSTLWPPEVGPDGLYRWTQATSVLDFSDIGVGTWTAQLRLASRRPADSSPPVVEISDGGSDPLAKIRPGPDFAIYTITTTHRLDRLGNFFLVLDTTPTFRPPGEPRALGVAFDRAELTPQGPIFPAPFALVGLVGTIGLLAWALGGLGGRRLAWGGGALLTLGLAGALAWNRLWVTPFTGNLLQGAALAAGGVGIGRGLLAAWIAGLTDAAAARRWQQGLRVALVAGLLLAAGAVVLETAFILDHPRAADFHDRWETVRAYNAGAPLYDMPGLHADAFRNLYKYPPLFGGILRPFALLDYDPARDLWRLGLLACLLVACAVLIRNFTRQPLTVPGAAAPPAPPDTAPPVARFTLSAPTIAALLFLIVAACFRPVVDAINYGQLDPPILLLLALTLVALRAGRPGLAGVPLALAAALKLYPGLVVVYLLWRREWRAVASFALAFVGWNLVAAALTSPSDTLTYWTQVLPLSGGSSAWVENQTWSAWWARLFTDRLRQEEFPRDLPVRWALVQGLTYVGAAGAVALSLWAARRPVPRSSAAYALGLSTLVCVSVFALPVAWIHYLVAFLLPLAVALYALAAHGAAWWAAAPRRLGLAVGLLGAGTVLLAWENIWAVYEKVNLGGLWKLVLSYKLYGELAVWVGLLILVGLASRPSRET